MTNAEFIEKAMVVGTPIYSPHISLFSGISIGVGYSSGQIFVHEDTPCLRVFPSRYSEGFDYSDIVLDQIENIYTLSLEEAYSRLFTKLKTAEREFEENLKKVREYLSQLENLQN